MNASQIAQAAEYAADHWLLNRDKEDAREEERKIIARTIAAEEWDEAVESCDVNAPVRGTILDEWLTQGIEFSNGYPALYTLLLRAAKGESVQQEALELLAKAKEQHLRFHPAYDKA